MAAQAQVGLSFKGEHWELTVRFPSLPFPSVLFSSLRSRDVNWTNWKNRNRTSYNFFS